MPPTTWQQLGAYVYTGPNLSEAQIQRFKDVGGKWICPWVYQDMNAPDNIALIPYWRKLGLRVGGMFNGFGGDPLVDAENIATIAGANRLDPVILDLETAYQYPSPACQVMPTLLSSLRKKLPKTELCVNTNGLNDSMIWNGHTLSPPRSCFNLGVRVSPQWFSAPRYEGSPWTDPETNMKWMTVYGDEDNFYDPTQKYHRAVPLSYIHPTVEPTGVEDAVLKTTLDSLTRAKKYGFTVGIQIFALERVPEEDWKLLDTHKGKLWLV